MGNILDLETRVALLEVKIEYLSCNYEKMETMLVRLNHLADRAEATLNTIATVAKVAGAVFTLFIGMAGTVLAYYAL